MLKAQINGKNALIYVDTGAPVSCIDESKSRVFGLGMLSFENRTPVNVNANGENHRVTVISRMVIADLRLDNTPAVLIDFREINHALRAGRDRPNDMILGLEALTEMNAVIDFTTPQILVKTGSGKANIGSVLKSEGWSEIPIRLNEGHLVVDAKVGKAPLQVVVDTGSPTSVLNRSFCNAHSIPLTSRVFSSRGIHFQDSSVQIGRAPTLKIGSSYTINQLPVAVFNLEGLLGLARNSSDPIPEGLLGCETLVRNRALIDCGNMKLYLNHPDHSER